LLFQREAGGFSAVLADVVMPALSGTELAARVHGLRPDLPVVLMSGYTEKELMERGFDTSHGEALSKPFGQEELVALFRRAVGQGKIESGG
jgi:CheY-like chemotaxis protein